MKSLFVFYSTILFSLAGSAQDSLHMETLFHWDGSNAVGSQLYDNVYNEVWGYAQDGREYAIIGTSAGTHFFDITEPENGVEVDFVAGRQQGPVVVHRDYHNMGAHLYMVCQEGLSSLQIADLSYLPDSVHVVYDSDELIRGSHNIFIDTVQAKLFSGVTIRPGVNTIIRLQVLSLAEPLNPVVISQQTSGVYTHDMYVNDGRAILNQEFSGMAMYDFSNVPSIFLGSITNYPGVGYNHSGYPTPDGTIYAMADETHGSPIKILDISDPSDIQVLSTVSSGVDELSIAHNQIVHENKLYSAYYYDGIYVWSIEDPENPVLLGYYDTSILPHDDTYEGAWGVYPFLPSGNILVSDMQTGLWVFTLDATLATTFGSEKPAVKTWPNPVSEQLNFSISENIDLKEYSIISMTGKQVGSGVLEKPRQAINLSALASGIYILRLEQDGNPIAHTKFVKE